ncbi:NUDIX domain-containing protein [Kitasatospora sp. NPDC058190]
MGESLAGCGIRETHEETGIEIEITGIVGTYTNPGGRAPHGREHPQAAQ